MKKFIAIYNAPAAAMEAMAQVSDEDKAKGMEAWFAWKAKHESAVVDFGAPVMPGQRLAAAQAWTNSGTEVSGYSILQASDYEAAQALFADHPHLHWAPGCSIDLHKFAPM